MLSQKSVSGCSMSRKGKASLIRSNPCAREIRIAAEIFDEIPHRDRQRAQLLVYAGDDQINQQEKQPRRQRHQQQRGQLLRDVQPAVQKRNDPLQGEGDDVRDEKGQQRGKQIFEKQV